MLIYIMFLSFPSVLIFPLLSCFSQTLAEKNPLKAFVWDVHLKLMYLFSPYCSLSQSTGISFAL